MLLCTTVVVSVVYGTAVVSLTMASLPGERNDCTTGMSRLVSVSSDVFAQEVIKTIEMAKA